MKRALSFRRFRKAGHHVRLHDGPMPPLLDGLGNATASPSSPGASEPYGSLLDSLLSEQATLTQIMKGFEQQLQAGADGEALLCSSRFQEALARLGAAQQHAQSECRLGNAELGSCASSGRAWRLRAARGTQPTASGARASRLQCRRFPLRLSLQAQQQQRELLSVARERIVRDYPMLLEASRSLLELLSSVTTRANGDINGELQQVPALSQTRGSQGRAGGGASSSDARSDPRCV